jgi:hypothetical protein
MEERENEEDEEVYTYLSSIYVGKNSTPSMVTVAELNYGRTEQHKLRSHYWSNHLGRFSISFNLFYFIIFIYFRFLIYICTLCIRYVAHHSSLIHVQLFSIYIIWINDDEKEIYQTQPLFLLIYLFNFTYLSKLPNICWALRFN